MKNKKFYVTNIIALIVLVSRVLGDEEPQPTLNTTNDNSDLDANGEPIYISAAENVPEPNGAPPQQPSDPKSRHHPKHKDPNGVNSHTRSPVYEVVNQPCYSPGCGGGAFRPPQEGNRWNPGRNRYGPGQYPRQYEPRRRGGYREYYPGASYGPGYGPSYGPPPLPDYGGYGSRGMPVYPQDRFDGYGGYGGYGAYGRPMFFDYFLK